MAAKFRQWKYKNPKKLFISPKKLKRWIRRDNCFVYDTRTMIEFDEGHINHTKNVNRTIIRAKILTHSITDRIVLIGANVRTNATVASWARYLGYIRIHLIDTKIDDIPKTMIVKSRKRRKK